MDAVLDRSNAGVLVVSSAMACRETSFRLDVFLWLGQLCTRTFDAHGSCRAGQGQVDASTGWTIFVWMLMSALIEYSAHDEALAQTGSACHWEGVPPPETCIRAQTQGTLLREAGDCCSGVNH